MEKSGVLKGTSSSNPFGRKNNANDKPRKHVNVGNPGETPKKVMNENSPGLYQESPDAPQPTATSNFLPAESRRSTDSSSSSRPKTSRGRSHPSPDEFYNYVVPSPDTGRVKGSRLVINHEEERENENNEADTNSNNGLQMSHLHKLSSSNLLGMQLEGVPRDRQIALLGCWLFGSALRI